VYVLTLEIKIAEIHDINLDINISNDDVYNVILILFVKHVKRVKVLQPLNPSELRTQLYIILSPFYWAFSGFSSTRINIWERKSMQSSLTKFWRSLTFVQESVTCNLFLVEMKCSWNKCKYMCDIERERKYPN